MNENFYKQRRNLILISSIVVFINLTAGKIEKINILGTELKLENSLIVPWVLGLMLFYLFLRYLQYTHDVQDKEFGARFFRRVEYYLAPKILRREHAKENSFLRRCYPDIKEIEVRHFEMFNGAMPKNIAAAEFVGKMGGVVVEENNLTVLNQELTWPFIRSSIYICLRTRLVTDYVFPVLFAGFAFVTYWSEFPKFLLIKP